MKTNKILVALALPALFAACTAEEIVNQADNNALENRALLGDLVVNMETPVASRASWSDETLTWGAWEEDDAFSGALVDGAQGTVDNYLLTNYVYKKNAAGEWTTTSQMVEGIYSFYSYKGITAKNDRKPVAFDLTAQVADLDNPTKVIDDNQLFFSPLYKVEAKNTTAENNIALPLTFYPYHSIAAFKMVNTTGQTLLISQIIANGEFAAKGTIMPKEIAKKAQLMWSVRKGEKTYKVTPKTTNADGTAKTEYTSAEILKAWQESDIDNIAANAQTTLAMNCGNWAWGDDEEVTAYMVIPANAKISYIDINVVDEEGEARLIRVKETATDIDPAEGKQMSIASTGITKQTFKRSVPVAMFGYTTAGAPKSINVKAENLASAAGYYIDSKEALIDLINVSRGDVKVYNFGKLAVDAEIAEMIAEYTGGVVTFTNPIEIKDTEEVSIENIVFGAVTVKGADATTDFEGTTVVFENATAATLNIEAGATVTIKGGVYGTIDNKGTLSVEAKLPATYENGVETKALVQSITKIVNNGTLTVKGIDRNVELQSGSVNYVAVDLNADATVDALAVSKLTVSRASDKDASITIGENVAWNVATITKANAMTTATASGSTTISKKLTVNNNGTINSTGDLHFANVTNNGHIAAKNMFVYGVATNNKTIKVTSLFVHDGDALTRCGDLTNNGFISGGVYVDQGGTVTAKSGSAMTLKNSADTAMPYARINNTEGGNLGMSSADFASTKYVIYHEYTNLNLGDLQKLNAKLHNVNTIVVTGVYSVDAKDMDEEITTQDTSVKRFEFKNGSSMVLAAEHPNFCTNAAVEVAGNVTFSGWSAETSKIYFANVDLTMKQNSVLTVRNIGLDGYDASHKLTLKSEAATGTNKVGKIVEEGVVTWGDNVVNTNVAVTEKDAPVLYNALLN